jgi:hypothetical protein
MTRKTVAEYKSEIYQDLTTMEALVRSVGFICEETEDC